MNFLVPPILLTLLCGLSVGIGAFVALFIPRTHGRTICLGLAFSAGIMLWLGLSPLFHEHHPAGSFYADGHFPPAPATFGEQPFIWFLVGVLLTGALEFFLCRKKTSSEKTSPSGQPMRHTGEFSALAIAAHGFPECLAIFGVALMEPMAGLILCAAIMAHHFPLGLSIALPFKQQGSSCRRPIAYALLAGLLPATAAILLCLLVQPIFSHASLGLLFPLAGGIMTCIAVTKLMPSARSYGSWQTLLTGWMAGLLFASLLLQFHRH